MTGIRYVANDMLDTERLTQAAMSAYVDEALNDDHAHDRLVRASRAAAFAVVGELRESGHLRQALEIRHAVHGTHSGYGSGCRCEYCAEASNVYARSRAYWTKTQGHNKIRETA